jgi:hypothetical protein
MTDIVEHRIVISRPLCAVLDSLGCAQPAPMA